MTRRIYRDKMNEVFASVYRMGFTANDAVRKALHAFRENDVELSRVVKNEDERINRLQEEIDRAIITLIAMEHPVAHDLCRLFASSKIVVELERLGDHAVHVAKVVRKLTSRPPARVLDPMEKMGEACIVMLEEGMDAFKDFDGEKAKKVAERDNEIDDLHRTVARLLLSERKPDSVENTMYLLFAARFLERIGDHVTNICEWICYATDAETADLNPKH